MHTSLPLPKSPPPKQVVYWQKALFWQSLGFLIVIVLTWSDALFDLTHALLGLATIPSISCCLTALIITSVVPSKVAENLTGDPRTTFSSRSRLSFNGSFRIFITLGGASLFVPQQQVAWLLWELAALDAYAFFRLYGWFYHANRFDLMSLPSR